MFESESLAPHTHDVVDMIASGHLQSAMSMHEAYVTAAFESEDLGATEANMLDVWMAGALLESAAAGAH